MSGSAARDARRGTQRIDWELRASEPMLPMGLLRSRGFAAGNMVGLLMFAALFSAVFFMAQYQQTVLVSLRSRPGCGSFRGPERCSSSRRSRERWSTGSASAP